MSTSEPTQISAVDVRFQNLVLDASISGDDQANPIVGLLRRHLGVEPATMSVASHSEEFMWKHAVWQAGIDAHVAAIGRTYELVGANCPLIKDDHAVTLQNLQTPPSLRWPRVTITAPTWEEMDCGYQETMPRLRSGMYLVNDGDGPYVIWVYGIGMHTKLLVQVGATSGERAASVLDDIRRLAIEHSPYIGKFFEPVAGSRLLRFHPRPRWTDDDGLVLDAELEARVQRHALGLGQIGDRLTAAKLPRKRGLLLFGPPGTGKTHAARYIASQLPDETSILSIPPGTISPMWYLHFFLPLLGKSAMVVLDDVDVIAADRSSPGARNDLFDLLDTLDGLHSHGDVLFLLLTNRLEVLEGAVAARPGRIDEALEVPKPDGSCRRALIDLYSRGLDLVVDDADRERIVARTDGVTASFFKELFRRATLVAVENGSQPNAGGVWPVDARDVFAALDEMLDPNNPMTAQLLGAPPTRNAAAFTLTSGEYDLSRRADKEQT